MNSINNKTDQLLQDYLQGRLHGEKLRQIETGLEKSEEMRSRLEILKLIDRSLSKDSLLQPSANFTQQVMHNLHHLPAPHPVSPKNGLLLLAGILVATGLAVALVNAGVFNSLNGMFTFENLPMPKNISMPRIPAIPVNGKWIVNGIIVLNIGLAFIVLDRTILKPLFTKRVRF